MSLKVVVLTWEVEYAWEILRAFKERNVVPCAVVVFTNTDLRHCFRTRNAPSNAALRVLEFPLALARQCKRRVKFARHHAPLYRPFTRRVVPSGVLGSARLLRDLRRLRPDVLVLGSCGIVNQEIIDTARLGVLNVHPAILPYIRGLDPNAHSLLAGVPMGASCHLVDKRIDTGALIERRLLPVYGDASLEELRRKNSEFAANLMADVVARTLEQGQIPSSVAQTVRFPLQRPQTPQKRLISESLAQSGRARELFDAWKGICLDQQTWTLPQELFEPPTVPALAPLDVAW